MVRRSVLAAVAFVAMVLGCVVVSTPASAVVDNASIMPSPNAGTIRSQLYSVSCVSASDCVAVGSSVNGSVVETLVMAWDGAAWTIVPSPNAGSSVDLLKSVSCVSVTDCVAVGYTDIGNYVYETLVMAWDGAVWTIVPSPNAGTSGNQLYSVSCASASSCVAVGYTYIGNYVYETLVMAWDGAVWSVVPSPNAGTLNDYLFSVSCVGVTDCVAVGYSSTGSGYETLTMGWDGATWSIVPSPNVGSFSNYLESVSCVSGADCVAVGWTSTGSAFETLVMVWDGTVWSVVSSPNAGTSDDTLDSVSCVSASDCVAVGTTDTGSAVETLVMVWNGATWSIVTSPNAGTITDQLDSVSCVSVSDCVAVGSTDMGNSEYETLVMSLTGPEPAPTTTTTAASDPVTPAFTG